MRDLLAADRQTLLDDLLHERELIRDRIAAFRQAEADCERRIRSVQLQLIRDAK
jgi:chaperonin cofactor prefoldin